MKRDTGAVATFTYGTGTIPAGATNVHVTHGCGSAPSSISVTPGLGCEAPIQVLASEIGATEFIVRFIGDVVLGADALFLWGAMK
jgi:hypothetical protein